MLRTGIFFLFSLLFIAPVVGATLEEQEIKINSLIYKLLMTQSDEEKRRINTELETLMEITLKMNGAFVYPFDSVKNIGFVTASDNSLRLITWNISLLNGTYFYTGFIQKVNSDGTVLVIKLNDKSDQYTAVYTEIGSKEKWFGALYYQIVVTKYKGDRIYTLLGWDGNNLMTTKKIIEILTFDSSNQPVFGKPLFVKDKQYVSRVVFEYSKEVSMSLKYEKQFLKKKKKFRSGEVSSKTAEKERDEAKEFKKLTGKKVWMIVYDHLAPKSETLKGQYQYYGPDLTYDGFVFRKGKWDFVEHVLPVNETEGPSLNPASHRMSNDINEITRPKKK